MAPRDFQRFKDSKISAAGIPIVGQPELQPIIFDQAGRELHAGDLVILQTAGPTKFRIQSITPVPADTQPKDAPPLMEVRLVADIVFWEARQGQSAEFLRYMTAEEVDARRKAQEGGGGE